MNPDLLNWLDNNKMCFNIIDEDVIEITGFGKMYYEDTSMIKSIFRTDADNNIKFNTMENIQTLQEEGINYIVFQFGDNWYYYDTRKDFEFQILKYVGNRKPLNHTQEFVNLGIHTPFELLNGSFSLTDWIKKAKYLGQSALGICDYNTMAATLILQKECEAAGIQWVFGYSLTFTDGIEKIDAKIYCQSQEGLQNLLRIQKCINVDSENKIIDLQDLLKHGAGNIIVFSKYASFWLKEIGNNLDRFFDSFDDCFYQLDLSEFKAERIDIKVLDATKCYFDYIYDTGDLPPVLICDCYYLDKDDAKNKIILNKIAEGAKARYEIERNFMPQYDMADNEKSKYANRHEMFLDLLEDGFNKLVPKGKEDIYRKQLDYEVYVLESTNNVDYMLVQYDTVNWARKNGILVGCGRGSAGGCLVLYLLGITLIDPIKYDLLFERFLLPERAGLYPSDVTIIGDDVDSNQYIEVTLENHKTYKIDKDAQLLVKRAGMDDPIVVYADELQTDDDIQFDNRDLLFTLNEI